MDRHRSMYKANSSQVFSPQQTAYQKAKKEWANRRNNNFLNGRTISLSPTPKKNQQKNDENVDSVNIVLGIDENVKNATAAPAHGHTADLIKKNKREEYLKNFLAWKERTKKEAAMETKKRKPFVSACSVGNMVKRKIGNDSFAPDNHVFKAPAGLKDPTNQPMGKQNLRSFTSKFAVVELAKPKPTKVVERNFPNYLGQTTAVTRKTSAVNNPRNLPSVSVKSGKKPINPPPPPAQTSVANNPPSVLTKSVKKPLNPPSVSVQSGKKPINPPSVSVKSTRKPKNPLPVPAQTSSVKNPPSSSVKSTKKLMIPPPPPAQKSKKPTTVTSKKQPAKPAAPIILKAAQKTKNPKLPALKLNNRLLKEPDLEILAETPKDADQHLNRFSDFLTSTRRKSSSFKNSAGMLVPEELGETISPIDNTINLLQSDQQVIRRKTPRKSIAAGVNRTGHQKESMSKQQKNYVEAPDFKFIRFSVGDVGVSPLPDEEVEKNGEKTPPKNSENAPSYMSPYVSVSRGKVSSRKEKEKRNSIYLQDPDQNTPTESTEYRRTMETVRYFRKQLAEETDRLLKMCDEWDAHKAENLNLIEDAGLDMINVTIGQTRLLTNKKFQQFRGLIDKCEAAAEAKRKRGYVAIIDPDAEKPILPEDLEGFWSMVGLQIENVEQRFNNLRRWKANKWADPDEIKVKVKAKKTLTKVMKAQPKAKPIRANSALQALLKKAHAEYKQSKKANNLDEDTILTPSKKMQQVIGVTAERRSTPRRLAEARAALSGGRRLTITGKKRASVTSSSGKKRTSTNTRRSVIREDLSTDDGGSPQLLSELKDFRKSLNLLKSTLLNEQERRSISATPKRVPNTPMNSRKSILKTPGTKGKSRNVIFNEELHYKSPDLIFTVDDSLGNNSKEDVVDEHQRSYRLRSRRVALRDSSEFVIPQ